MTKPNALIEFTALHLHRPALDATPAERAAWYRRKSAVLEHLAAQGSPELAAAAEQARAHAERLAEAR